MVVKFLQAGCGDSIVIRFLGDDARYHNIVIDGGTEDGDVYENGLKSELHAIIERKESLDLWIITHIDDDHIGGVLRFIDDNETREQFDLKKTMFWYNYAEYDYDTGIRTTNRKSVRQGILLRDYLLEEGNLLNIVTNELPTFHLFGATIQVLSPEKKAVEKIFTNWKKDEVMIKRTISSELKRAKTDDYSTKIDDFNLSVFSEDTSPANQSSIAFLLTYGKDTMLFSSDSRPSVLARSLIRMGFSGTNRIRIKYMQVPHHGSKMNMNDKLLKLVDCTNFIVSADGFNVNNLPNKETFARIIANNKGRNLYFFLTYENDKTASIFKVDGLLPRITITFPNHPENGLNFELE